MKATVTIRGVEYWRSARELERARTRKADDVSFETLIPMSYDVIVIDPPWRFRTWGEHNQAKSASKHYDLMQTDDIKALPVGHLAQRDCIMLLWATGAMLPQA